MPSRPTTRKGQATLQRVLDAACVLFARQGVRATTMDQVGAASGTGRGQLYLWFDGKPDLVRAVVAAQVERVLAAQRPLLAVMATPADVRGWCREAARQYAHDDPVRCPIGSLVHELAEVDGPAALALADGLARWQEALAVGLRRVEAGGGLAPALSADALAVALLAAYQGGVLLAAGRGDRRLLAQALEVVAVAALVAPAGSAR